MARPKPDNELVTWDCCGNRWEIILENEATYMTKPYTSMRIPVRKIPYDELPPLSPDNPFDGYVGPFTTEAELLDRYEAGDLARWQAEHSEFSDAFVRWCAAHPLPPNGIFDEPAEANREQ